MVLTFDLEEGETRALSQMLIQREEHTTSDAPLELDGEQLTLLATPEWSDTHPG